MNFEPVEAAWPERFALRELQHAACDVSAHVVEVWRTRVGAAAEVKVVAEPEYPVTVLNRIRIPSYSTTQDQN